MFGLQLWYLMVDLGIGSATFRNWALAPFLCPSPAKKYIIAYPVPEYLSFDDNIRKYTFDGGMRGYSQYWADIWKLSLGYDQQGPGKIGKNYNLYTFVISRSIKDKIQDETL